MKEVTWLMAIDDDLAEGFLQHNQLTRKFGTHNYRVEVVAHIGCTGIQGFPHHLTGRATGGPIVAMTGVDPEACKSSDGIGARVTPIA